MWLFTPSHIYQLVNTFDLVELCKMSSICCFISENKIYREVSFGGKRFLHTFKKEKQLQTQISIEAENKGYFNRYIILSRDG